MRQESITLPRVRGSIPLSVLLSLAEDRGPVFARTSVAIMTRVRPWRKSQSVASRSAWSLSEWIAEADTPFFFRNLRDDVLGHCPKPYAEAG